MFGPNLLNGAVDETMLDNYVILPMDDCRFGEEAFALGDTALSVVQLCPGGYIPAGVAPIAVVAKSSLIWTLYYLKVFDPFWAILTFDPFRTLLQSWLCWDLTLLCCFSVVSWGANASDCCDTSKYEVDLSLPNFAWVLSGGTPRHGADLRHWGIQQARHCASWRQHDRGSSRRWLLGYDDMQTWFAKSRITGFWSLDLQGLVVDLVDLTTTSTTITTVTATTTVVTVTVWLSGLDVEPYIWISQLTPSDPALESTATSTAAPSELPATELEW